MLTNEDVKKFQESYPVGSKIEFEYRNSSKPGTRIVKIEENDGVHILGRDSSRNNSYRKFMVAGIINAHVV